MENKIYKNLEQYSYRLRAAGGQISLPQAPGDMVFGPKYTHASFYFLYCTYVSHIRNMAYQIKNTYVFQLTQESVKNACRRNCLFHDVVKKI